MNETTIILNIGAGALIVGILVFFLGLLAIIWKGKKEIADTVKEELSPYKNMNNRVINAITEVQTVLRNKYKGVNISHNLMETSGSPLGPTEFGAQMIKDSGLEKILNDNSETLCIKLKAALPKEYTEYDVQEKARELLMSLKDDPMMIPLKRWVYEHPSDITLILKVGGLWLRDDFLKVPRRVHQNKDQRHQG